MNVTIPQEHLLRISRYLQNQLQAQATVIPLQVKCALKDTLWVLVQHPPGNAPDPQQVFTQLERSLQSLPRDYREPLQATLQSTPIKLFMRVLGQQKPYAFHHVTLPDLPSAESDERQARAVGDRHEFQTLIQAIPEDQPHADSAANPDIYATFLQPEHEDPFGKRPDSPVPDHTVAADSPAQPSRRNSRHPAKPSWSFQSQDADTSDSPFELESDLRVPDSDDHAAHTARSKRLSASDLKPWIWGGVAVLSLVAVGAGLYALTRPCVIGTCAAIANAETTTESAIQAAKAGTPDAIAQTTQDLMTVRQQLTEIPPWSGRHGDAQTWQQQLDQVLAAEAQASQATAANGDLAAQSLWSGGIAQLAAVPTDSPLHAFAQARLQTYRANLALAQQRAQGEQTAQQRLTTAKKTAELAIARQKTAQTPADWQQASVTWQVVLNTLEQIPRDTRAYTEAQQLLESYRPQAAAARDRATQEQKAQTLQNQATAYEKQAKAAQQRNQWSQAIAAWQNALKTAQQIPTNTSLAESAKTLVDTYRGSLSQAQAVVKIRGDLDRVCNASGRICNYTLTNDTIQVRLVPSYERKVRTLGGLSQFSGDYDTLEKINVHLASLARALQTVSTNAGLPVQVYNSDNDLIAAFTPNG